MPIHRGPRLDDLISRLVRQPIPIQANIYKTWPNLASGIAVLGAVGGGAWVEFISAANAPTTPFTVFFMVTDGNGTGAAEIGVGAAGSEVAVAGVPSRCGVTLGAVFQPQPFPIIPGGSRVSVRVNGSALNTSMRLISALLPPQMSAEAVLRRVAKMGTWYPGLSAAATSVTSNPVSGASWTYGVYSQIISATDEPSPLILMSYICQGEYPANAGDGQVALGYGAVGSEIVFAELPIPIPAHPLVIELPVPILVPGSTRLAAKYANFAGTTNELDYNAFGCVKGATYR